MTINATAPILLAMYVAVADEQGIPARAARRDHAERHPQGVHRARHVHLPAEPSMRLVTDIFAFCADGAAALEHHLHQRLPHARGRRHRGPGDRLHPGRRHRLRRRRASSAGLDVDEFAGRLSFFFGACNDLFEEVAKFRAARRMWARIMKERFGANDPRSMMCRFHVQTAGSTLTAQSVDNNVVRVTLQALAAVLGGTQSLHTNARDEALGAAHAGDRSPRAAHAADHRPRERRDRHARPARRLATTSNR